MRIVETKHIGNLGKAVPILPYQLLSLLDFQLGIIRNDGIPTAFIENSGYVRLAVIQFSTNFIYGNSTVYVVFQDIDNRIDEVIVHALLIKKYVRMLRIFLLSSNQHDQ